MLLAFAELDEQGFDVGGLWMRTRARGRMKGVVFRDAGPIEVGKKGTIAKNNGITVKQEGKGGLVKENRCWYDQDGSLQSE